MKNFCKIIFIFFVLSLNAEAQTVTWQKYYNYESGHDEAFDAIHTFDGGYLIVGRGRSSEVYMGNFLLKTDYLGNIEWKKLIGSPAENRNAFRVSQVSDSGYIIVGDSYNNILIYKIDKNGEVIWEKRYTEENAQARASSFVITADSCIITCGIVYFFSPLHAHPYIVKTDMSGNLKWKKYYTDMIDFAANDIIEIENNEYMYCASKYLRKIDSSGNEISTNAYWSGSGFLTLFSLAYEKPGIVYSGGTSVLNGLELMHLIKVNSDDSLYWSKRIVSPDNDFADCTSICLVKGNIFMTGAYNMKGVVPFAKVSGDGKLQTYNLIPESQSVESYANSIRPTNDNGFIICGSTRFGTVPSYKYLVIKTDSNGYAPELVNIKHQSENAEVFELYQNYPNPFNPNTTIQYHLQKNGSITLTVFDVNGKKINELENGEKNSGFHLIKFDGSNLPSGIYFYQIEINGLKSPKQLITKMMLLIK